MWIPVVERHHKAIDEQERNLLMIVILTMLVDNMSQRYRQRYVPGTAIEWPGNKGYWREGVKGNADERMEVEMYGLTRMSA